MLVQLITKLKEREKEINDWLQAKREVVKHEPLYASVDLRNSGFKVVAVDTNLFPAGWNNLCPNYSKKAGEYFKKYFETYFPGTRCLLVITEDHTRNLYYFSNLRRLQIILEGAGFEVKLGSLNPEIQDKTTFQTAEGEDVVLYKINRTANNIFADNKRVCQIIINNDFSIGIPDILQGVEQNLLPSPRIGWHYRRKSEHFKMYHQLMEEFGQVIGIDPWFFESYFEVIQEADFDNIDSREHVAKAVDELIVKIKNKYQEHGIDAIPSVFIKNNAGTYGLAVIRVNSGDDVRALNQHARKQMRVGKGSVDINSIILQEGVATVERVKGLVAEPVMYLVGNQLVGGFYRLNQEKGDTDNLNSKGMQFSKSCLHENFGYENIHNMELQLADLQPLYDVIASIASLAAGLELKALDS